MCCPRVVICFVFLVLHALSAPTNRTGNSDSSSISITEDPENEDVELRRLELEKSTEFINIFKKIISYMSVHFTESGELNDLKCEIRTREMHTNFVYHNIKGKLFPKKKPTYTSFIQPALGIGKYFEITPEKFRQRIYFFNTTQQLFIKNDTERDDNNLLKEKQNIDTYVPEASQLKNIKKSETLFPKYKTTEEIDSVADAITVIGQSYDENNKNKTDPQNYYAEKRENTTQNLTSTFNSQSGTFNKTTIHNSVNEKFTSTTLKPRITFSHQRTNTDENIIFNLNRLENTESSVYSHLNFTKNNVSTSSKHISRSSDVESTSPVAVIKQQNNTTYKSNIPKNHIITNVSDEERSMEESYSVSANTPLDSLTSTEEEKSYSIYYDDKEGTSSSLPTVSNDGSKRFKQDDSLHTDLVTISRYTLDDSGTSVEVTTMETKDLSNGVTKGVGATIYNTVPSKFGFLHNSTIIESMLRGLDRETTSSRYYKQSFNSKELSSTTEQVSTESIPLHSDSYDFKSHYYNMASSFYPDIYNYSTSTDLPSVTTQLESNFSMIETENVTYEGQGRGNVTHQNRSNDSIDVIRSTLPSQNYEFLNRISSSIQMKKNATLPTRRIYVIDDLKSEAITQNNTYSTSNFFEDYKETTDKKEIYIPEHKVKGRTTDVSTEPSTTSVYQYKSTSDAKTSLCDTAVPEYTSVHTNGISSTRDLIYTLASQTSPQPSENMPTHKYDKPVSEETASKEININPSSAMTTIHSIEISVNPTELVGENSENTTNVKLLQHSNGNMPITTIVESNLTEVFSGESQETDIYHTVPSKVSKHDLNNYTRYSKVENKSTILNIVNLVTNKYIPFTSTTALQTDQMGTYNESESGTKWETNSVDTYNKSAALNATDTLITFNTVTNLKQFNQGIHNSTTPLSSKYSRSENYSKVYPFTKDIPYSTEESSPLTKSYNLNERYTFSYYYKGSDNFTDETLTSTKSLNESYSQEDITPDTFTTVEMRKYVLNSSTYDFGSNESKVIQEENGVNRSTLNVLDVSNTSIVKDDVTYQDVSHYSPPETTKINNYQSNSKFNTSPHYSNKPIILDLEGFVDPLKSTTDNSLETTAYTLPSLANIYETENKSLTETSSKFKTAPMSSIRPATSVKTEIDDISQTDTIKIYSPFNDYMQNSITTDVMNDSAENDSFSNKNDMTSTKVYVRNEIMSPCTSYTKDKSQLIYNATSYATSSFSLTQSEILPLSSSSTMLNTISTITDQVKNKTGVTTSVTLEEEISTDYGGSNSENLREGMSTTVLSLYSTFIQNNYTLLPNVTSLVNKTRYDFSEHPVHNISSPDTLKLDDDINIDRSTLKSMDNIEKNATEKLIDVRFTSNLPDKAGSLSTPSSLSTPQNSNTIKVIALATNDSFDSHFDQSSGEEYGKSTPFNYQLENKTENTVETNVNYSYTDSPVDKNTNPYSEAVDVHISTTYPNAIHSIDKTSTGNYNKKFTDIINLTTAKINRTSFDANASNINNNSSSTPRSISTTEYTSKTDLTMVITGGAYKSTIHKYSEAKSSQVTLNDVTEIEPEDNGKAETHTRKNEFTDFSADVSDLITTEVDIDMDYSTPNIMNYMETTSFEEQSSKEKSSATITGDNHRENQTEKTLYAETNTQRNEYYFSGPEENSSVFLVDDENMKHKTVNFQKTTDLHNEKLGNLSNVQAITTIGNSVDALHTTAKTFNENNTLSTIVPMYQKTTTSKNVSNASATESINTNDPIDSKTEVIYNDEINTQFDETTPFLNSFTFFLPTTDLVTNYLPVRIHPLMAFSEIK